MVWEALPRLLAGYPCVSVAYLYGSALREGAFSSSSDLDVALAGADMAACLEVWREAEREITDWPLDVRPLDDSPFADRVRATGEVIYARADQGAQV
ncbi:MAG: nucleotidyltransferase domain-containing protein [Gemmatimonadota bacterium]